MPARIKFATPMERLLWQQLQEANEQNRELRRQLGMVLDRQFYRPVIAPRTDLEPTPPESHIEILTDATEYPEQKDQELVTAQDQAAEKAQSEFEEQLEREFQEIALQHAEAHAEASA